MRITLDIASDVLEAVEELARREQKTTGEVLSELARRALIAPPVTQPTEAPAQTVGVRRGPKRGGIVLDELLDKLSDDSTP